MSMNLESVLGKRKYTDQCPSQFAELLGESKFGRETTKEEEASGGEKELDKRDGEEFREAMANGELEEGDGEEDDNDEPCEICKEKGHWRLCCPKATKEKEASDGKELGENKCGPEATKEEDLDLCDWMKACNEELRQAIANGEIEEGDGEEEDDDEPCEICNEKGHWHLHCPWKFELPFGPVPAGIPPLYRAACKGCYRDEFDEKTGDCAYCGFRYKNVLLKKCSICWRFGHMKKYCPLYGKEVTRENHPSPQGVI